VNTKGTLTVFDLDDTLFHCHAQIKVKREDGTVEDIPSSTNYDARQGDVIDYSQFRSAQYFYDTAVPMDRMVTKFKNIRKNTRNPNSRIIIVTARSDFDNQELFMGALKHHELFYDDVHVYRAGNFADIPTTPARKCYIIGARLVSGQYNKARMFDDSIPNLKAFLAMQDTFPEIEFEAWLVFKDGEVEPYLASYLD
jgi:hypothetical protein